MEILDEKDPNALLFHYTSLGTALEHILPEENLLMGRLSKTNDPRENKTWNFGITTSGANVRDDWKIEKLVWEEAEQLQAALRILCLTQDHFQEDRNTPIEVRGFGIAPMWARYGEEHKGVCLAFKKSQLTKSIGKTVTEGKDLKDLILNPHRWEGPVAYRVLETEHQRPEWDFDGDAAAENGEATEVRRHIAVHYEKLIFTKSLDWNSEREFRIVYLLKPEEPEIFIPIKESLCAVILGVDLPDEYHPSFKAVIPDDVPIYKMKWNWGHYQIPMRV